MRVKTLLKMIYKNFGRGLFTSNSIIKSLPYYEVYPTSRNAIYVCIHRCWKMGLLSRKKFFGNSYEYQITHWGIRYLEEGYQYQDEEVRLKLLKYIVQNDDWYDKVWALNRLVPRLLRRFLPHRRAQHIYPEIDIFEIHENLGEMLKRRIRDETLQTQQELEGDLELQCLRDLRVISLTAQLLYQFYGSKSDLELLNDFVKWQSYYLVEELIEIETYEPPKRIIFHKFPDGRPFHMWNRRRVGKNGIERHPTIDDLRVLWKHLDLVVDKLLNVLDTYRTYE